jgi:UDPglucose--hexose-1-phosphate uridylyltransferase
MSEIRQDPTTKEWVIIANERRKRPSDFIHHRSEDIKPPFLSACPFCPGNEGRTPPTILSYSHRESNFWQIRAFNNQFPAVTPEKNDSRKSEDGFFLSLDGLGYHEVIVESPLHNATLALMEDGEVSMVLRAYQERYCALARIPLIKTIIIFKNHGPGAGTSLEHPHSQIVATSIVPRHIRMQYDVATRYYDDHSRSLYSDMLEHEQRLKKRIIMESKKFLVFHPFASHRPFETWIMPKTHQSSFSLVPSEDLNDLARILRIVLCKMYKGLNNPDFNYCIDSPPIGEEYIDYFTWHLRIIPRITEVAGFEIGSGIYINTALPEETAQFMRDLEV